MPAQGNTKVGSIALNEATTFITTNKHFMHKHLYLYMLGAAALTLASCSQDELGDAAAQRGSIIATMNQTPATRTAVGGTDDDGTVGIVWTDGDRLGVFDAGGEAQKCYAKSSAGQSATATFSASGTAFDSPAYAYYPYNSVNDGNAATALKGNVPATQSMDDGTLSGDYKWGTVTGGSASTGYEFGFTHLFSLARLTLNATGTLLNGDKLKSLTVTATRDGEAVALCGDFTSNATNGEWSQADGGANAITLTWTDGATLDDGLTCYMNLFPNVKKGDLFTIEALGENYRATLTATSLTDFAAGRVYTFPLDLNDYATLKVYDSNGALVQDGPSTQETVTGSFTCATLNVDGLPDIINDDGPGSDGTATIGNTITNLGWDFFGVSEDFTYHSQLISGLSAYTAGTYRGTASSTISNDTDGLEFFCKTDAVSFANETIVEYTDKYGSLLNGADEVVKKGFRHYEVTVADGVVVDVYITHMNTWKEDDNNAYYNAQISQLQQLRDYVLEKAKANKRPAIIMGDTNMRYTRHDIQTNFISGVTSAGYTFADPWVDLHRGGTFPIYGTKSLMLYSKYEGDTTNDILCSDDQRGEVVDKVWYINVPGADVQLKATSSKNDVENFTKSTKTETYSGTTVEDADGNILTDQSVTLTQSVGLADHFPVVVTFEYSYTKYNFTK